MNLVLDEEELRKTNQDGRLKRRNILEELNNLSVKENSPFRPCLKDKNGFYIKINGRPRQIDRYH